MPRCLPSATAALPPSSGFPPISRRVTQTRLQRISGSFFKLTRRLVSFVSQHRQPVRNAYGANGAPRRGRSLVRSLVRHARNIVERNFRSKLLISVRKGGDSGRSGGPWIGRRERNKAGKSKQSSILRERLQNVGNESGGGGLESEQPLWFYRLP